jgi:flagellar biosynthetic protein FliR
MTTALQMPDLFGLTQAQFETFLLVLVRVSVILFMVPIFSTQYVPQQVRFGLGLVITFVLFKVVPSTPPLGGLGELTAAVISQAFIGLVFGFIVFLAFTGIEFAGEILDITVGFAVVNVINPLTSQNVSVLGGFYLALASMIYLAVDAHHFMFEGLAGSFTLLPLPYVAIQAGLVNDVMAFFSQALLMVFQIAGQIVISLFITNIGLALMTRIAPQLNVFAIGFPLQSLVGLSMIIIAMPLLGIVVPQVFEEAPRELDAAMRLMRPPG